MRHEIIIDGDGSAIRVRPSPDSPSNIGANGLVIELSDDATFTSKVSRTYIYVHPNELDDLIDALSFFRDQITDNKEKKP